MSNVKETIDLLALPQFLSITFIATLATFLTWTAVCMFTEVMENDCMQSFHEVFKWLPDVLLMPISKILFQAFTFHFWHPNAFPYFLIESIQCPQLLQWCEGSARNVSMAFTCKGNMTWSAKCFPFLITGHSLSFILWASSFSWWKCWTWALTVLSLSPSNSDNVTHR